jgi:hypothetical protein
MSRAEFPVLLIGGVAGESTEEVLRLVGPAIGDLAIGITDGETGIRRAWVLFVAYKTWYTHPVLKLVRKPRGIPGMPEYIASGYDDLYKFTVPEGVSSLQVETLHYATEAAASYTVFRRLRRDGVVPRHARFQVCLPFPEDACRLFAATARDMDIMVAAYVDAVRREIAAICEFIPPADLVIQFDVNWEVIAIEYGDTTNEEPLNYKANGDPLLRFAGYAKALGAAVPADAKLGFHLCYGDLAHKHYREPTDLAVCVRLAHVLKSNALRRVSYVHMPVPRNRNDDAYFAPLRDLSIGDTTLYIGLVHYTDGIPGTLRRLEAFKRHYNGPSGVTTECGIGRRPPDQDMRTLFDIHRAAAAAL